MADFDPFANQGGPAAWDPEHDDDSKKLTDELLSKLDDGDEDEPSAGPPYFTDDDSFDTEPFDAGTFDSDGFENDGD